MSQRPLQERIEALTESRTQLVHRRTPKSREWRERSLKSLPLGVPSSFQDSPPYPIFFERGKGSRVWDVDGNEYSDYHNGFGVMAVGHAHPKIVQALTERLGTGTHFAQPVAETTLLAEEICQRFQLDQIRFTNSGTEATMDAIRLARGATGRDAIVKIEGSYHGHHESVLVSIRPARDAMGPRATPASVPFGQGTPAAVTDLTLIVPYNDAEALDRLLTAHAGQVAALIMEPVMMNVGIIDPEPGYLQAEIAKDGVPQLGTFNGNPLSARAGLVALTEILTPGAYDHLNRLNDAQLAGCRRVIDAYDLPMYTTGMGAKGAVMYAPERLRDYRGYAGFDSPGVDADLSYLSWLYEMTQGVFMTPGIDEQWTLSVQHGDDDVARYVNAFEAFAREVSGHGGP